MKTKTIISLTVIIVVFTIGLLSLILPENISEWITGKTTTRAFIVETDPINCSVNLTPGINYVSFPCETGELPLEEALKDINNQKINFEYVFVYNPLDTKRPWKSYNPHIPNWTVQEDFTRIDRRIGYVIRVDEPTTYRAEGLKFPNTNNQLRKGWNLVGYPSTEIKTIQEATTTIEQEYEAIHSYQDINGTKTWLYHIKNDGGTLTHFKPGYAYWIKMNEDAVWRLEW